MEVKWDGGRYVAAGKLMEEAARSYVARWVRTFK